jgi:hypothetical protein
MTKINRKNIDNLKTDRALNQKRKILLDNKKSNIRKVLREKRNSNSSISNNSVNDGSDDEASDKGSHNSNSKSESHSLSDDLIEKIHELVFSKIEMPSSTNKSIIGSLEYIETIIQKINPDKLYDVYNSFIKF